MHPLSAGVPMNAVILKAGLSQSLHGVMISGIMRKVKICGMTGNPTVAAILLRRDIVIDSTEAGYGEGIGICQWSFGRREAFIAFAGLKGEPWPGTSLGVQIQFMEQELETNQWLWTNIGMEYGSQYNISHAEFKTSTNVEFATTAFCANFERCHAADSHLSNRIAYAQRVFHSFK